MTVWTVEYYIWKLVLWNRWWRGWHLALQASTPSEFDFWIIMFLWSLQSTHNMHTPRLLILYYLLQNCQETFLFARNTKVHCNVFNVSFVWFGFSSYRLDFHSFFEFLYSVSAKQEILSDYINVTKSNIKKLLGHEIHSWFHVRWPAYDNEDIF